VAAADEPAEPARRASRDLELDAAESIELDVQAIVLGAASTSQAACPNPTPSTQVRGQGSVQGDGTGPQRSYFVCVYEDGGAHCQCPAYYFRAVLRHDLEYRCKHILRALVLAVRQL
jgi:hypothetical protein